ncbi:ABC transporter ATP-binding protein [Halobaculum sp. EA56]|uniref:ABC transporter ATP-binding protein n=1 Tax=Halobaculum sp. EA56 TaxID=3421648 RepID=UPI003EB90A50
MSGGATGGDDRDGRAVAGDAAGDADRVAGDATGGDGSDTPMIAVRDLVVSRGGERVLDGVSLSVDRGELVGLVGPNGAGKTTLVATVNGTLAPGSGRIELDGTDRTTLSQREVARLVATVPQETNTAFEFDVETVVEMGRTPYVSRFGTTTEADREAVRRAMDRAGVAEFADRSVTTLSGGQRQRVLFARALAAETPALLLDEPTASLDINHQLRTLELVREIADEGKAALAAIHDLNLAARVCDRLVLLAGGTVRARGTPREVLGDDALADAFGVATAVNDDPAVGSPMVTALRDGDGAGRDGGGDGAGRNRGGDGETATDSAGGDGPGADPAPDSGRDAGPDR